MFLFVVFLIGMLLCAIGSWIDELWPYILALCFVICGAIMFAIVQMKPVLITEQGGTHTYSVYEYQMRNNTYEVSYVDELSEIHTENATQVILDNETSEPYVVVTTPDTINRTYALWFKPDKLVTQKSTIILYLSE